MAQQVTNIEERRPPEQPQQPNLPPPEVAVAGPRPRRNDWALFAVGLGSICAICYFAEEILVVILVSVLLAFALAPITDLLGRLRLPRWICAGTAVLLLLAAFGASAYYGI